MPEESGTWNGRGQIKPAGLPRRSGRQRGRLHCHVRGGGIVEDYSFRLGGGIVNLKLFAFFNPKKVSFYLFFFFWNPHFSLNRT